MTIAKELVDYIEKKLSDFKQIEFTRQIADLRCIYDELGLLRLTAMIHAPKLEGHVAELEHKVRDLIVTKQQEHEDARC